MATYIDAYKGYIADVPLVWFKRCDGKIFHYDEITSASVDPQTNYTEINGGWSNYPTAYLPGASTMDITMESGQFNADMFLMANNIDEYTRFAGDYFDGYSEVDDTVLVPGTDATYLMSVDPPEWRETYGDYMFQIVGFDFDANNWTTWDASCFELSDAPFDNPDDQTVIVDTYINKDSINEDCKKMMHDYILAKYGIDFDITEAIAHPPVPHRQFFIAIRVSNDDSDFRALTEHGVQVYVKATSYLKPITEPRDLKIINIDNKSSAVGEVVMKWPVYASGEDCTDSAIKGHVVLHMYKCRVSAMPGFNTSYKQAATNSVTWSTMDPKREDKAVYSIAYLPLSDSYKPRSAIEFDGTENWYSKICGTWYVPTLDFEDSIVGGTIADYISVGLTEVGATTNSYHNGGNLLAVNVNGLVESYDAEELIPAFKAKLAQLKTAGTPLTLSF